MAEAGGVRPPAPMAEPTAVLVRNGKAAVPWIAKADLLKDYTGAYTTARTVDQSSVFEFAMHCRRLHETGTAVLARAAEEPPREGAGAPGARAEAQRFLQEQGPAGLGGLLKDEIKA